MPDRLRPDYNHLSGKLVPGDDWAAALLNVFKAQEKGFGISMKRN